MTNPILLPSWESQAEYHEEILQGYFVSHGASVHGTTLSLRLCLGNGCAQHCGAEYYSYTLSGQVKSIIYPNNREVHYSYNASGDLLKMGKVAGGSEFVSNIIRNKDGRRTSISWATTSYNLTSDENSVTVTDAKGRKKK